MRLGQKTAPPSPPPAPAPVASATPPDDDESAGESLYDCLSAVLEEQPMSTRLALAQAFGASTPFKSLPPHVRELMEEAAEVVWGDDDDEEDV